MPQHKGRFSVPHPEGADVANAGEAAGIDTPQVYAFVTGADGQESQRLIGWARVALGLGETKRVSLTADPRLLANYDAALPGWRITDGKVGVAVGTSAEALTLRGEASLVARTMKP